MPQQGRMLGCGVWIRFLPSWNPGVLALLSSVMWSCPVIAPLYTPSPTVTTKVFMVLTHPYLALQKHPLLQFYLQKWRLKLSEAPETV